LPQPPSTVRLSDLVFGSETLYFAHSTMLAGRPAYAVGSVDYEDGYIVRLSNESGHYKAKVMHIIRLVRVLQSRGYDLTKLKVLYFAENIPTEDELDSLERLGIPKEKIKF